MFVEAEQRFDVRAPCDPVGLQIPIVDDLPDGIENGARIGRAAGILGAIRRGHRRLAALR